MPRKKAAPADITKVAREKLGYEALRPGQEEAVRALLEGHDTLVVHPTGSGKSAIYQIAGFMGKGSTVIVSPLIALQRDQIESIQEQTSADAVAVNSTQSTSELREGLEQVQEGSVDYVFLAPEQLRKPETIGNLKSGGISLFVVDEAHCISEWGHDFRPDYLRLGHVIEELGHPRVLALTATAAPRVRREIVERLRLRRPKVFVQSLNRPNIYLRVDHFQSAAEKREALIHRVRWADKPGIVYTATRKAAEEIVAALAGEGVEAAFYHGGLKGKEREAIQDRFMDGDTEVIVATNAFGMGVDKPDVRFVYHYDPADSLDAYYQEIGRAGRDGEKSEAVLFYRDEDIGAQSYKTGEGNIRPEVLEKVASRIAAEDKPVDAEEIAREAGLSQRKLTTALQRLEDAGAAETLLGGKVRAAEDVDPETAARIGAEQEEQRRQAKRQRLEAMRDYASSSNCRREILLRYFEEEFQGPCNFCDNCEAGGHLAVDPTAGTRREVA